jgi:hypothetical protein
MVRIDRFDLLLYPLVRFPTKLQLRLLKVLMFEGTRFLLDLMVATGILFASFLRLVRVYLD